MSQLEQTRRALPLNEIRQFEKKAQSLIKQGLDAETIKTKLITAGAPPDFAAYIVEDLMIAERRRRRATPIVFLLKTVCLVLLFGSLVFGFMSGEYFVVSMLILGISLIYKFAAKLIYLVF